MSRIWVVGSINMDFVIPTDQMPRAGETIRGGDLRTSPGGKGANQACAAARLGAETFLLAQVGNDSFGPRLMESLRQANVKTDAVGVAQGSSGCAFICVRSDGENAIVISPGANATLNPAIALDRLDRLRPADIVLLQLEIPMETVEAVAKHSHDRGAIVILDPAPAQSLTRSLLKWVSFLTPNQSESATILQLGGEGYISQNEFGTVANALLAEGPGSVILKLGSEGCFLANQELRVHIPGFEVDTVDTTAAGDVFNGALSVALSEKKPVYDAALFANAAAAIAVTRRGAQTSIPNRSETEEFLRSNSSV